MKFVKKDIQAWLQGNWKRLLLWLSAAILCGCFCFLTDHLSRFNLPWNTTDAFPYSQEDRWQWHYSKFGTMELAPGQSLEQRFTAGGNIVGTIHALYLEVLPGELPELTAELRSETTGEVLFQAAGGVLYFPEEDSDTLPEKRFLNDPEDCFLSFPLPEEAAIRSGERYCLTLTNLSQSEALNLRVDHAMQSGRLCVAGKETDAALNFGFRRTSCYYPSGFVRPLIALTAATMLLGLWLVLFTRVKEHILYLVLAVGFGIVTLFAMPYLYGFDMQYHFDSTYVLSNRMMGISDIEVFESKQFENTDIVHYYRRAGDDYAMFRSYGSGNVCDNYTDVAASRRNLRVDEGEDTLILVEANQGSISGQLYILYLPQALGFTLARLLGLRYIPMVMLGRVFAYAVFVTLMFFAIRAVPFGKRLFLILSLTPAVLTQTVSITRDGMIIGLSFFVIAKVLQLAYSDTKPTVWNWAVVIAASALLAPCKSVYLPVSFFWLLIIYRRYIHGQSVRWGKVLLLTAGISALVFTVFLTASDNSAKTVISGVVNQVKGNGISAESAELEEGKFTISYMMTHLPYTATVMINTLRTDLGTYLTNALQLFDIGAGNGSGMTVVLVALLLIECCCAEDTRSVLGVPDRYFSLLSAMAVLFLILLATIRWVKLGNVIGSYNIYGIQGRYLTPILPLLGIYLMNNGIVLVDRRVHLLVKASCCVFPAFYMMNLYLWAILN